MASDFGFPFDTDGVVYLSIGWETGGESRVVGRSVQLFHCNKDCPQGNLFGKRGCLWV